MVQQRSFILRQVLCAVFVVFYFAELLAAAEPGQQNAPVSTEVLKTPPKPGETPAPDSPFGVYGEFGPIFLHRQDNRSAVLIRNAGTGGVVLDAASLDLGWKTGLEARGGVTLGNFGAEVRWFNVGVFRGWSSDTNLTTPSIWGIPTVPALLAGVPANASIDLSSRLTNVEGNLNWRFHPYFSILAGARYMSLDDELNMNFNFGANVSNVEVESRNVLWGGQLGLQGRASLPVESLSVGGVFKAAFLRNSSRNQLNLVQQLGPNLSAGDHGGHNTWAVELAMDLRYDIWPMVTVVAGYQGLWIDKIAHATDQVSRVNLITRGGHVGTGSVWFHGPKAAIVVHFPN